MTGYWSLIKAEATKNYAPNPSLEDGIAGYTNYNSGTGAGTRTRVTTWQRRGSYAYELDKTGGGATDQWGAYVSANTLVDFIAGDDVTFSVDLNVAADTTVRVVVLVDDGTTRQTATAVVGPVAGRYSATLETLADVPTVVRGYVYVNSLTGTVQADGWQLERKAYATSYCDGEQDGCKWLGASHSSSSTRDKRSGAGGRAFNLDAYNLFVETLSGLGMPPLRHQSQFQAQLPGALWQDTTIDPRVIVISGPIIGSTQNNLHSNRKSLIDAIKPDAINGEAFWLEYTGANSSTPIRIAVRYDTGLEFGRVNGFTETVAIRWIAYDPLWVTDGNRATTLGEDSGTITTPYLARRTSAGWVAVAASLNGTVRAVAQGANGVIYFGGDFTDAGGVAAADYFAQYDPETDTVTALGTGMNGIVRAIVAHPGGNIYVGGDFTSAGGVSDTAHYARLIISSGAWQSMVSAGNSFDDVVRALLVTSTGNVILGGDFANGNGSAYAGIVETTLAGSPQNYAAMGTGTAGGDVYALAQTLDGTIYAGGDFTTMGGVTSTIRIAAWDGSAWTAMGTGANGAVYALLGRINGQLVLGGAFTEISGVSGFNYIAAWNGIAYQTLSSAGMDSNVRAMTEDSTGLLHVVGDFDSAGLLNDNELENYALWNDSLWLYPDGGPVGATSAYAVLITATGDLYIGSDDASGAIGASHTTVTNSGTSLTYPVFKIQNGANLDRLTWIKNETTGAVLYLDFEFVGAATEWLTIDLRPNRREVRSNYRGLVWEAVKPGSNISDFTLAPGANDIAVRLSSAGTSVLLVEWREDYWSADGVAT